MKIKYILCGLLLLFWGTLNQKVKGESVHVIPAIQELTQLKGNLSLNKKIKICCSDSLIQEAKMLQNYMKDDFGIKSLYYGKKSSSTKIELILDPHFYSVKEHAYQLNIDKKVTITSSTKTGIFYGIQTLRQLISKNNSTCLLPKTNIYDYPAFPWRSFMLDESRAFKGKKVVKYLLDEMARFKMNVFHWHLTDDQGWRIEIKKYPKLTEIGAWRDSTQIGGYKGKTFDGIRHGGYYSQEEIKEIIEYAAKRHIMIVPEFEMPGHESAAIAAYPWLGTSGKKIQVPCRFGVQYEVFNVASPKVYQFVEDVIDEIRALFPSPVIHIGGDEVKYDQWKASDQVVKYMKDNNISTPSDLQLTFTNRISKMLQKKGRRMMGWNDITGNKIHEYQSDEDTDSKNALAEGTIVQFWKGDLDLIEQTARKGYDIVNSYHYMTYLDYDTTKISLEKAYSFNPIPDGLPENLEFRILGLGCQMWGEEILSNERMYKMIFPRIAAYAECGWTLRRNKDYKKFNSALEKMSFQRPHQLFDSCL